jgi:hypothetical protein
MLVFMLFAWDAALEVKADTDASRSHLGDVF